MLVAIMLVIGAFTIFASLNTYEVIAKHDVPLSSVITSVNLTGVKSQNDGLSINLAKSYQLGNFGIPKKIRFPEIKKHFDIIDGIYENSSWKASQGLGHVIITDNAQQKVFGRSIVYMRINTLTTEKLGSIYNGDIINIVTTEGWQLGYKVIRTSDSYNTINIYDMKNISQITLILIDDKTGKAAYYKAELTKVGDRI